MKELFEKMPGKPGRRQTVSASAWIEREDRKTPFQSMVSLGKGRVYRKSTRTKDRAKALDFNRAHLLEILLRGPSVTRAETIAEQPDLIPADR
jgi:hypothetical protein